LRPVIEERLGLPLLGGLPEDKTLCLPERHLGRIPAGEQGDLPERVTRLGVWVAQHLDLGRIQAIADTAPLFGAVHDVSLPAAPREPIRLAVARDAAYCFYYPDNLALLQALGAEIVPFSPLADPELSAGIQGLYLGGGYPDLHAAAFAANTAMRALVYQAITAGLPTFAECGGFMYLCEALVTNNGSVYPMVGAIPGRTVMDSRLQAIGYREVTFCRNTVLGPTGERGLGHEFHHSRYEGEIPAGAIALEARDATGTTVRRLGYTTDTLLASYIHLHFGSNLRLASHFAAQCMRKP
jgi:cobyrinic acid a,c-diamide synthase